MRASLEFWHKVVVRYNSMVQQSAIMEISFANLLSQKKYLGSSILLYVCNNMKDEEVH